LHSQDVERSVVVFLRWIARMWGTAVVALVVLFAVMHAVSPDAPAPTASEWVGLLFFPFGVCVGLVMAWRWEAAGGAVTVASFITFYAWMFVSGGWLPSGPYFAIVAVPGAIFLVCRLLARKSTRREAPG
jgi:hypothetical protein